MVDLFIADIVSGVDAADVEVDDANAGGTDVGHAIGRGAVQVETVAADPVGEACNTIRGFVDGVVGALFSAIDAVKTAASKVPLIGDILAAGVDLFGEIVNGAILVVGELTAAVMAPVKFALEVLGTLNTLQGLLRPWDLTFDNPVQPARPLGIDQDGELVELTVRLSDTDLKVPEGVRTCARAIGAPLPEKPGTRSPISWGLATSHALALELAYQAHADARTDDHRSARFGLQIGEESTEDAKGSEQQGRAVVTASVQRDDAKKVVDLADTILESQFNGLPPAVVKLVLDVIGPVRERLVTYAQKLIGPGVGARLEAPIVFHRPDRPEPTASTTTSTPDGDVSTFCSAFADYELEYVSAGQGGDAPRHSLTERVDAHRRLRETARPPAGIADAFAWVMGAVDGIVPAVVGEGVIPDVEVAKAKVLELYRWMKAKCPVASLHGYPIDQILAAMEQAYGSSSPS